jgi:hypothetical protein
MGDTKDDGIIRKFDTGATRDTSSDKLCFDGFLSPSVLRRFAEYMHKNRVQSDGSLRDPDNWQKGIPLSAYIDSGWRHFFDWWGETRGLRSEDGLEDALCGLMFNVMGYLHEVLKEKEKDLDTVLPQAGSITWLKPGATLDEFFDARYKELGGRKGK